ncbi:caspase-1-like [Hyposmocoma kahamanoa]|uniref:caspase-1-like n=1 Tax=Hyposmocoma kahamanoa TaxID=1477025 RepID=UPI000E6D6C33|nr:caspase-1-like [Hyposmocoma kahamanoa]
MEDSDSSSITVDHRKNRALAADEPTYKLETFEKNAMIIFNQYDVNKHKLRVGTHVDGRLIKETLEKFGFEGKEHMDLIKKNIFKELEKFSSMDFTNYGCVVIVVMTHGGENGLLMAKDESYCERDILNYFKHKEKRTLVTKPIVMIIQACRGDEDVEAAKAWRKSESLDLERDWIFKNEEEHYHLPVEADTIVLHSSSEGKPSHRKGTGSWFITTLCKKIQELSITHDLESIMVEVKREVAIKKYHLVKDKRTGTYQINKQMPVVTSALIRKLYLRKFGDKPPNFTPCGAKSLPSTSHDCTDDMVIWPHRSRRSPAQILKWYHYMKKILLWYMNTNGSNKTAEFLLCNSAVNETNFDADTMQVTLIAMSSLIELLFKDTEYKDLIFYYEIL